MSLILVSRTKSLHGRGQSVRCRRLWLSAVVLFVHGSISAVSVAADAYFEEAMARIEQTLVNPPDAYGFVILDDCSVSFPSDPEPIRVVRRYSFFTSNGRVHYNQERFESGSADDEPSFRHVFVSPGDDMPGSIADSSDGKHTLTMNAKPPDLKVGRQDDYEFCTSAIERARNPDRQPFQILANPCFAPLGVTPIELLNHQVDARPDENGRKLYEIRWTKEASDIVLRLYFDPAKGDALVKSDFSVFRAGDETPTGWRRSTVREVEEWQELADGSLVPARFTMRTDHKVGPEIRLWREVSDPVVGDVDDSLFDTDKLADFNVEWSTAFARQEDPEKMVRIPVPPKPSSSKRTVWLLSLNAGVLVALAAGVFLIRRWRSSRAV